MSESRLHQLSALGQSVWIDFLSREMLQTGELERLMRGNQVFRWKENAELAYVRPLVTRYAFRDGRIVRIEMESP